MNSSAEEGIAPKKKTMKKDSQISERLARSQLKVNKGRRSGSKADSQHSKGIVNSSNSASKNKSIGSDQSIASTSSGENNNNICADKVAMHSVNPIREAGKKLKVNAMGKIKEASALPVREVSSAPDDREHNEITEDNSGDESDDMSILGDGVMVDVNISEDEEFTDELEGNMTQRKTSPLEEIPPEVIEQLKSNEALNQYFGTLIEAGVSARLKEFNQTRPVKKSGKEVVEKVIDSTNRGLNEVAKSPSDTTIYRPALKKGLTESNEVINKISNFVEQIRIDSTNKSAAGAVTPERHSRRRGEEEHRSGHNSHRSCDQRRSRSPSPSTLGRAEADKLVLAAEQLKASIQPPKG